MSLSIERNTVTVSSRYRDSKTGHFVSKEKWKRSKAQGGTRYVREYQRKQKAISSKWMVRYHVPASKKKKNEFNGEILFTVNRNITEDEANKIAAAMFRGESQDGVTFEGFKYDHGINSRSISIDDFDDLPDYEFLVYDDDDSYSTATTKR